MRVLRGKVLAIAVTVGCCGAFPALPAQEARIHVGLPGYNQPVDLDATAVTRELASSSGKTFTAAVATLEALKIPLGVRDSVRGLLGNLQLIRLGSVAGGAISTFLDCGFGALGPNANSYRVTMALLVTVVPLDAGHSTLRVGFAAGARDATISSKSAITCGSTGRLEAKVTDLIAERAAAP